jgi:hypothetical protein
MASKSLAICHEISGQKREPPGMDWFCELLVPKPGLYQRGLLNPLTFWAVPAADLKFSAYCGHCTSHHFVSRMRELSPRLTPI